MTQPQPDHAPARSSDELLADLRALRTGLTHGNADAARAAAGLLSELDNALSHGAPPPAAWIVTTPGQADTLPISAGPDGTLTVDVPITDPDSTSTTAGPAPSWGESRNAASTAITKAEKNADPEWVDNAREALLQVACTQHELTADDVWATLGGTSGTHEPRALGAIIRYGRRAGWLDATGRQTTSSRVVNHARPTTVWASTLHVPQGTNGEEHAGTVARAVTAIREFATDVPEVLDRVHGWEVPKDVTDHLGGPVINS